MLNADNTPGRLLQSNPLIHVNDINGLFTSDELTRVHDAVDAAVEPCGVRVTETTESTMADGTVDWGSISAAWPVRR